MNEIAVDILLDDAAESFRDGDGRQTVFAYYHGAYVAAGCPAGWMAFADWWEYMTHAFVGDDCSARQAVAA